MLTGIGEVLNHEQNQSFDRQKNAKKLILFNQSDTGKRKNGKNNAVIFTCVTEGQAYRGIAIYGRRDKE